MSRNAESVAETLGTSLSKLEQLIEQELALLEPGSVTAFLLEGTQVAVALEVNVALQQLLRPDALASSVSEVVQRHRRSIPELILLLREGQLARARSGRPQRVATSQRWREGQLDAFAVFRQGSRVDAALSTAAQAGSQDPPRGELELELAAIWQQVLRTAQVERSRSFFALGGSSLAAAQVAARVQERFGLMLPASSLFEAPTVAALAAVIERLREGKPQREQEPIRLVSRALALPLSPAQSRMRFLWQLDPASGAYNICGALRLRGQLDRTALQQTLDGLVARHEALRTRFPEREGEAIQHIDEPAPVRLRLQDLATNEPAQRETALRQALAHEAAQPFELVQGPLLRVLLLRLAGDDHALAVTLHHSVADGTSMNLLVSEFARSYAAYCHDEEPGLPALRFQYADYAQWQAERLASGEAARQLAYWRQELAEAPPVTTLPADRPRPGSQSLRGERLRFELQPGLVRQLRELGAEQQSSTFMLLLTAFQILIHRHTGQRDLCVGVPAQNRVRVEAESLLGVFVNSYVVRIRLGARDSFEGVLQRVKQAVLAAQSHQELPFERVVEALQPQRSPAYHPLFQLMYNHQQRDTSSLRQLPALDVEVLDVEQPVTRFDLSLSTEEDETGRLTVAFVYASDLFERARIEQLAQHFQRLLAALLADVQRPIGEVALLDEAELQQLASWSVPPVQAAPEGCVHEWISAQARVRPEAIALSFGEEQLSYSELERRANALAVQLAAAGAGADVIVGVMLERSLELIVAVLAILKAGSAYLPLDPRDPEQRLSYLLADSRALLLLTRQQLVERLPVSSGTTVLDFDVLSALPAPEPSPARRSPHTEQLAYVLYTSGTTGRPKAVANTHGALAQRLAWMRREYQLGPCDTLLHKTPFGFDVAVWEVLLVLLSGGRLAIAAPGEHRDPLALARLIQQQRVSAVHFVPSLLREFVAQEETAECRSLLRLFSGGEALSTELQAAAHARLPWVRLDNRYGPTEALINASYWTCRAGDPGPVPIGRPIPNTTLRVLDAAANLAPAGVPGELCIGGAGLARGYLGRAGLTAERFVPDPFAAKPGQRSYRTGDWARFRADGALEYLGRKDEQVKIRGMRIELGELEGALLEQLGVRAAAAQARPGPGGAARLVAYVVATEDLDLVALQQALERRLPAALVPSQLVRLEQLPLLSSGKLDRASLPEPDWRGSEYVAPESALERAVAAIWGEVLQSARPSLEDDFFAQGGHSLLATQLVARVRRTLDIELPLRDLFEARTLGAFASRVLHAVETGRLSRQPALEPVDTREPLPLSYSQERMWFLWQMDPTSAAYNVGGAVHLRGELDVPALARALAALGERHSSLRTTFPRVQGTPRQRIVEHVALPLEQQDLSGLEPDRQVAELKRIAHDEAHEPFNLETGPLLRVRLLQLSGTHQVLLVTLHHITAEGWAMDIFASEWAALYDAFRSGRLSPLAPLPVQYADYAVWQRRWLDSGEAARQLQHWKSTLGSEHPPLELPSDRPRPPVQSFRGDYHRFQLSAELSEQVRQFGRVRGVTLAMTVKAALYALLYRYTQRGDLFLGIAVANRIRPELEGLIGAFLNTQVLRCQLDGGLPGTELLTRVRSASLDAQAHQDVPFHAVVEAVSPQRSAAHLPLFQVMCNVQRWEFQQGREVAGLTLSFVPNDSRTAKCDLALDVSDVQRELACSFTYSTDLFDAATVERMAEHWLHLLRGLITQPELPIGDLPLFSVEERAALLRRWNAPRPALQPFRTVHESCTRSLQAEPDAIRVVCRDSRLSGAGLLRESARLAARLRRLGVGPEVRVGVHLDRSVEALVAILAVLRAGGCFVPLDPQYPAERLAYMLEEASVRVLVSHGQLPSSLQVPAGVARVDVDDVTLAGEAEGLEQVELSPENLAYIIFTSGSTGRPKAVAVPHAAWSMHSQAAGDIYGLGRRDTALCLAALGFDAFLEQAFVPLISGARLVVSAPELWSAETLCDVVQGENVTLVYPPTSRIVELALHAQQTGKRLPLRRCCVGGEAVSRENVQLITEALHCPVTNGYGPTETVITPLLWRSDDGAGFRGGYAPIGHALGQRSIYVLDERLQLVAPGVVGELYIGTGGLARGYLNQPGLSAERFVPDPFGAAGGRLYRTGDRVRDRGDGCIEFVGRQDGQIKIRGYRIELGEIEARLAEHPSVQEAVVVVQEARGRARLVAYVAAAAAEGLTDALKAHLSAHLPDYMVPAQIGVLAALPRTPNGKIDRRALPELELSHVQQGRAPEGETELVLAEIWQGLLGLERVGADDNFFELGGDSIISLQVVSRARERGLLLAPRDLFLHQTVAGLARVARPAARVELQQGSSTGAVPFTPVQARFFAAEMARPDYFNQALLLQPRQPLQARALERALRQLGDQHDALRLRATRGASGVWQQHYCDTQTEAQGWREDPRLWLRSFAHEDEIERIASEAQRSLRLAEGPLLRAVLLQGPRDAQRLLVVIHHLAVDGVSWRILIEDLERAYRGWLTGAAPELPPKTSSFKLWAEQLREHALSAALRAELPYWLAAGLEAAELPRDRTQGALLVSRSARQIVTLSAQRTEQLLTLAPKAYRTQVNDLLLAGLSRVLSRYSGGQAVAIELEGHGREELFEGVALHRSVGWFTSAFPVRLAPALGTDGASLAAAIQGVKEELRRVPNKGLGYGLLEQWAGPELREQLARSPRPEVTFNYLGQFDQSFAQDALFTLAEESAGPNQAGENPLSNRFSVQGQVSRGQLTLSWAYSRDQYDDATVERLLAEYQRDLEGLIEHTLAAGAGGLTPSDVPLARLGAEQLAALPVAARSVADIYPLSPLQLGLLFHALYSPDSELYVNQLSVDVDGLDRERFERAWQQAVDRHDILRTAFLEPSSGAGHVQVVLTAAPAVVREIDATREPGIAALLEQLARRERAEGFDLTRPPLQKLLLVRVAAGRHRLIWTHHHLLLDGWSSARLMSEVLRAYAGERLEQQVGRYRDYIEWLVQRDVASDESFWKPQLATLEQPTLLSSALPRSTALPGHAELSVRWDEERTARLSVFARRERITLNTLIQGSWILLLQRYTGQQTVAFGATVAGRPAHLPGAETTLGLFINTVPVIQAPRSAERVGAWLRQLQDHNQLLREHEHASLAELQRWAGRAGQALFDTLLVFENYPLDRALRERGGAELRFGAVQTIDRTNYALTVEVSAEPKLSLDYKYATELLDAAAVHALQQHHERLLLELSADAEQPLAALSLPTPRQLALLASLNRTERPGFGERCLQEWIELQARHQPAAPALVQGQASFSFGQLNAAANRLARLLRARGVGPDVLVGVCAERSLQMVVGLLAILKAGGAYVPLDPTYPEERLRYMIEDSGIPLLLTQASVLARLPWVAERAWCLDRDWAEVESLPGSDLPLLNQPAHLAYCIYTSGSTGRPKAAAITHGGLDNYLRWAIEEYRLAELQGSALHSSISFDLTVTSLWAPLCAGKRVLLTEGEESGLEGLVTVLSQAEGAGLIKITPSHALALAEALPGPVPGVGVWVVGGEALSWECVASLQRIAPGSRVINEYGPTETVVGCCIQEAQLADRGRADSAPIGKAIANTELYVLDAALQRAAPNVTGELYIGGAGVARGYRNRAALTAERFVPHPFSERGGERLYRTGDLARYRDDGVLEYLGRIDQQVKIRGYRIELGEIEARLLGCSGVKEAAVVARQALHGKQLVGYVVASTGNALDEQALRVELGSVLPDYMVPQRILTLPALPLTPNGKLDQKALPAPESAGREAYAEPEGDVEQLLAQIWAQVLGIERVGRNDNFFDLGGDSIVSLQVVSRARHAGLELAPRDIFQRQTVQALAQSARVELADPAIGAVPEEAPLTSWSTAEIAAVLPGRQIEDVYPLAPAQQGMLFHALYSPESRVYQTQLSVPVEGLDATRFAAAWRTVMARHEILRTGFVGEGESRGPLQVVLESAPECFELIDLSHSAEPKLELASLAERAHARGFDLREPPLQRVLLVRLGADQHQLIWTFHHLLMDGWSSARLIEEVLLAYLGEVLPPKPRRYREYIAWLARQDGVASERFFREKLRPLDEPTLLASALSRPEHGQGGGQLGKWLTEDQTAQLVQFARQARVTLSTLVQGAWLLLLQRYTGQSTVACGVTVAGRPASLPGVEHMLGLFINTLPMIQSPAPRQTLGSWLQRLQDDNLELREYEPTPLYEVQRWGGRAGQALFDSIVVFENYPVDRVLRERSGAQLRFGEPSIAGSTNYPLTLEVRAGERLNLHFSYDRASFDEAQVGAIARHLEQLLGQMARSLGRPLAQLSLVTEAGLALVRGCNATGVAYPDDVCLHEAIEAQVQRTPDAVALCFGGVSLSYAALNARANQLARRLRTLGVGPDVLVGVYAERSAELVLALLGILKAGGAYVPLDPEYPEERVRHMLGDSGVGLVLTQERLLETLPGTQARSWCLDRDAAELDVEASGDLRCVTSPQNLAYCIYTSGSTGKPKGAGNTHAGIRNRLSWMQAEYQLTSADAVLQKTPFSFDVSVWEFFWPLLSGARLVVAPPGAHRDPAQLREVIVRQHVTTLHFVPSMLQAFVDSGELAACVSLRQVMSSGEALPVELQDRFLAAKIARLHNLYGPTEASVDVSYWECRTQPGQDSVPIGHPIHNTTLHVLDVQLGPVPVGVTGELYLGGVGLARGYHGRPALTAERFVPDPLGEPAGARLYRTGDLVRRRADGVLEYVGRTDHQVKLRGFRIELGEIESRLREQPGVRDAVVVARDASTGKQLIGYVQGDAALLDGAGLDGALLRAALRDVLPEYMVPAHILVLASFPLTPSGKLDRRALPAPELGASEYSEPEGETERQLAQIWGDVLRRERISRDDNFFDLGGDSIVSLQVVTRARQLGYELTPRQVFEHQTVRALAARAERLAPEVVQQPAASEASLPLSALVLTPAELAALALGEGDVEAVYPLSPMQQGMLFHSLYSPESDPYVNQLRLTIRGLDAERLQLAWSAVMARHASLRAGILPQTEGRAALQLVLRDAVLPVEVLDLRDGMADAGVLDRRAQAEQQRGFDLARPPLQRIVLLRLGEDSYHLIWTYHHILLDGWSSARLVEEVLGCYLGEAPAALVGSYQGYIDWLGRQDAARSERFWKEVLAPLEEPSLLAGDVGRWPEATGHAELSLQLGEQRTRDLVQLAQKQRVTLNTLIQAAWTLLLRHHTGQRTVAFGATVAGRPASVPGIETVLGLFINTLPVIQTPQPQHALGDWLRELQGHNLLLREHEHTPLYDVQRWAGRGAQALFDTLLVFENYPVDRVLRERSGRDLHFEGLSTSGATNYALSLEVGVAERLSFSYGYQRAHFDEAAVRALAGQLDHLLEQMLSGGEQRLAELTLPSAEELCQLRAWNETAVTYALRPSLHAALAQQAAATPERVALVCGDEQLSYVELDARSNRIARHLRQLGVGPDCLVGVCAERSLELVLSVVAILKAGGAYVPLDPEYPRERLWQMIEDSGLRWILTLERCASVLPAANGPGAPQVWLVDRDAALAEQYPNTALEDRTQPANLAYCIYTSGSTGKPKAVAVSHGAVGNRLRWVQEEYQLAAHDRLLQKTPFSFDVAVGELLWPLLSGARLVLAPPGAQRDPAELVHVVRRQQVTVIDFVPSMLQAFVDSGGLEQTPSLRLVTAGAEVLPKELAQQFVTRHAARLHNMYGPTEASIDVTAWEYRDGEPGATVPIGRPMANTGVYVLDAWLNPVPVGVKGELYISGAGLARGYLGSPGLSADRFIPDPFALQPGQRLYRTGDVARYRADGAVEYVGRQDQQVKVRGHRIELGEVEARLRELPGVQQAVVVVRDVGRARILVGYVVGSPVVGSPVAADELPRQLREQLASLLPPYMVPSQMVVLDRLPVTPSGKIDRKALPAPDVQQAGYVAPETLVERQLAQVMAEVLGLERVGVTDNFFELGGDSIVSLQVVAKARQAGLRITPRDIFEHQSIAALLKVVALAPSMSIDQGPATGDAPLTPIQARFFEGELPERHRYNQALLLSGREPLDAALLERALQALVVQHDALRLRYEQRDGWRQSHATLAASAEEPLLWDRVANGSDQIEALAGEAQGSLGLEHGPLLRGVLMRVADGSQRLLLVIHHLVVDGVSWRVLVEDLQRSYRQLQAGEPLVLPAKTSSFQRWSQRLSTYAASQPLLQELEHWLSALAPGADRLPCEHPQGSNLVRDTAHASVSLTAEATSALLTRAPQAYRTQVNDLLLTALSRALCAWTGQAEVLVELEGHGREELFEDVDITRTVGWFTSEYPVRLSPPPGQTAAAVGASIRAVKEQLRQVPNKGIGYGVLRYLGDAATRQRLAQSALPRVTFNYLGQLDRSFGDDALLSPAAESSGRMQSADAPRSNWLTIDGRVYAGELRLSIHYSREMFEAASLGLFAERLQAELLTVIQHCCSGVTGVTPSDFPLLARSQPQLDALALDWANVEELYPLSPMQEGLLVHTLLEPGSGIYLMQDTYRIENEVDVACFERAWRHVARLHPVLRTAYVYNDDGMLQIVQRDADAPVDYLDLRVLAPEEQERAFSELLEQELRVGFDMGRAPLWRVRLVRTADAAYRFVFSHHHILMDAWSHPLLFQDVSAVYQALVDGAAITRNAPTPYRDFIAWLSRQDRKQAIEYWGQTLAGFTQATALPIDPALRQSHPVSAVGDEIVVLSAEHSARFKELAQKHTLTVNTLVQAAWALTMARYSGQRDVLFGVTVAGRPTEVEGLEKTVGLFINSIPLRVRLPSGAVTTREWLLQLFKQNVAMRQHEHLPLLTIQNQGEVPRGEPFFHSLFVFENAPEDVTLLRTAAGMGARSTGTRTHTNYPLTVVVYPGSRLGLHLSYDQRFFRRDTVLEMLAEFERLLHAIVRGFDAPLREIELVSQHDRQLLLEQWNETERAYPLDRGYAQLFEAQVARAPQRVAVGYCGESLTLATLNVTANRIAHALLARQSRADQPVAILGERDPRLLSAILGVLKAGGGYVPLDPKHPPRRMAEVLQRSGARTVVSATQFRVALDAALALLPAGARPELLLWDELAAVALPEHNPPITATARSLAYVIYTSGSTGVPKGAMVEQAGMLNNQLSKVPWLGLGESDVIAQTASQCFDISVWQFLTGLLCGARVEIVPDAIAHDSQALLAHAERTGITVLESVPSLMLAMLDGEELPLRSLRALLSTGEALPPELARRWLTRYPQVLLGNAYGPAECSDDVAVHVLKQAPAASASYAPVGKPTDNNRIYVLDADLELVPVGVVGELCVAGTGVGRGYLGEPGRTAEVFLPNPFARSPGERLYRTGDLGRYSSDGILECLGRVDQQVKIRGYRIELGEIEARLREHEAVADAVVAVREAAHGKRLVGYVVARDEQPNLEQELTLYLRSVLPEYMVPAQLVRLEQLPLSANGKVDRKALPDPEWQASERYLEPSTEIEKLLTRVWQDVLGVPRVGITDNFFDLGGDSVVSLQMVSRARQVGLAITPRDVFQHHTVQALARVAQLGAGVASEQGPATGSVVMTPVQAWFFQEEIPERHFWNQSVLLHAREPLEPGALRAALECLVEHHDALRLRYALGEEGQWLQAHADLSAERERWQQEPLLSQRHAADSAELTRLVDEAQGSLSLEHGLFRALCVTLPDGSQRLLLAAHHLVVDAVSWRVLLEDLQLAYRQLVRGVALALPAKTTSFQRWAQRQSEYARSASLSAELDYWCSQLGQPGEGDLPRDRVDAGVRLEHAASVQLELSRDSTSRLLSEAPQAYRTQVNDLLLTALARALCRFSGKASALVELEGHGREDLFEDVDLSRTVGWFTSAFPVRLSPHPGESSEGLGESIKQVKEQLRAIPNKGIGFGMLKYLSDDATRGRMTVLAEARVTFNYLGQFDRSFDDPAALIAPASESAGASQSRQAPLDNWLSINGQVYQGRLALTCVYSSEMYRAQTMQAVMADFQRELEAVIDHCTSQGVVGMTPSDVVGGGAEQEDIDAVLRDLELG
ncbi:MAG: pyoverdine synthetase [Pseudomonadota bacterium]|jgi:amino acid adenylation domain-containing protein/non-ribosomal peptide synthase protein (TIGR01720 family)